MADDLILPILKNLQNSLTDLKQGQADIRSDLDMQFAALNERLSGQLISEIEMRNELKEIRSRLQRLEKRAEIN